MALAPYATGTPALIAGTHRQDYVVRATHPDWPAPITLDVIDLAIGWDESRSPRCTATLTVPADTIDVDLLDPLAGVRIEVDAGYITAAGTADVHPAADLGLRSRTVNRPRGEVQLDCAGDEARMQDLGPGGIPVNLAAVDTTGTVGAVLEDLLATFGASTIVRTGPSGPTITLEPGTDLMDMAKDLADQIDAEVYDDGLRTWRIRPRPVLAGTPAAVLTVGAGGTLTDTTAGVSRGDGYANRVVLRYSWRPAGATEDTTVIGIAYAVAAEIAAGNVVRGEDRDTPTTLAAANAAAAALLKRALSRGRTLRLTAVAAWWLRPGDTVTVQLPTGDPTAHLVAAVDFDAVRGSMDVTTRLPDDATITTGE